MWRATSRNKVLEAWVSEKKKEIEEEYKDKPLVVERNDVFAMILAAVIVIGPLLFIAMMIITLAYLLFHMMVI